MRGIVATEDARVIEIDGVEIKNTKQQGIQLNLGVGILEFRETEIRLHSKIPRLRPAPERRGSEPARNHREQHL